MWQGTSNSDSLKKADEEASPSLLSKEQASACGSSCSIKEVTNTDEVCIFRCHTTLLLCVHCIHVPHLGFKRDGDSCN